jgi:hypothetical protein
VLYTRVIERDGLYVAATEDGWEPLWENLFDQDSRIGYMTYNGAMYEVRADEVANVIRGVPCRGWKWPIGRPVRPNEVLNGSADATISLAGSYLDLFHNGTLSRIDLEACKVKPCVWHQMDCVQIENLEYEMKLTDLAPAHISAIISASRPLHIDPTFRPIIVAHEFEPGPINHPIIPSLIPSKAPPPPPVILPSPQPFQPRVPPPAAQGLRFVDNPSPPIRVTAPIVQMHPALMPALAKTPPRPFGSFSLDSSSDSGLDQPLADSADSSVQDQFDQDNLTEEDIARMGLQDVEIRPRFYDSPIPDFLLAPSNDAEDHIHSQHYSIEHVYVENEEEECPICFQAFAASTRRARLICFCTYHVHCINGWFEKKNGPSCPTHSMAYADAQRLAQM